MKQSNKFLVVGLASLMAFAGGLALVSAKQNLKVKEVSATDGYTTYLNEDFGFATRDPNDTRIVIGDTDGGEQTVGNVVADKAELKFSFKRVRGNYWFGVGGYAIYVSNDTTIRFLYLGYNANGYYSRSAEKTNLVMKTYDGTTELTTVTGDGILFANYTDVILRTDLTDWNNAVLSFRVIYDGVEYYPFEGTTRIDSVTYTHTPSGFADEYHHKVMFGVNATEAVSILKFQSKEGDFAKYIGEAAGVFSYNRIGDLTVELPLSQQISAYTAYLNDHLNSWLDASGNPIDIANGIVINNKTFGEWISYNETNLIIDSGDEHGIHKFPSYLNSQFSPVTLYSQPGYLKFFFNTAYIAQSNIVLTFKAGVFSSYYNGITFRLLEDLTFYSTINENSYGSAENGVKFVKATNENVGNYTVTEVRYIGEFTAAGGQSKFKQYRIYTDMPRNDTIINQSYPHDHYRYMFDNIMFNGRSLTYYNVWGRGNDKDYTDRAAGTYNLLYEVEHPATGHIYNMVTWLRLKSGESNYVFEVEVPNKLMEDFGYTDYEFTVREGSLWVTSSGLTRFASAPRDVYAAVAGQQTTAKANLDAINLLDYREAQRTIVSNLVNGGKALIDAAISKEEIDYELAQVLASIDEVPTDAELLLEERKISAKAELDEVDLTAYRTAERTTVENLVAQGKLAIDAQTTLAAVNSKLAEVQASIATVKTDAQYDAEEAETFDVMVNSIGVVTLQCEQLINECRAYYNNTLDAGGKALVTMLATLEAAEARLAELKQAQADAAAFDTMVDDIGEVTLEKEMQIRQAQNAYDELSEDAQGMVTKLSDLNTKVNRLNYLLREKGKADTFDTHVEEIGTVTLDSEAAIVAAREEYEGLSAEAKGYATKLSVLEAAEARLAVLKEEKTHAEAVEALIAAIGDVDCTIEVLNKKVIARNAYNNLNEEEQDMVSNYAVLVAAEEAFETALANYKSSVKAALQQELQAILPNYRTAEQQLIQQYAAQAATAIETGECKEGIDQVVAAARTQLATIKTADDYDHEEADAVETLINNIGTVTLCSEEAILEAKAAYNALTDGGKGYVTNYATLQAAEARLNTLKEEKAHAEAVETLINAIGEVDATQASKNKVDAAYEAYQALNQEEKGMVSNKAVLDAALANFDNLLGQARQAALDEIDEFVAGLNMRKYTAENQELIAQLAENAKALVQQQQYSDNLEQIVADFKAAVAEVPQKKAPVNKGCGGSVVATSVILSTLALAGLGLAISKKRKED